MRRNNTPLNQFKVHEMEKSSQRKISWIQKSYWGNYAPQMKTASGHNEMVLFIKVTEIKLEYLSSRIGTFRSLKFIYSAFDSIQAFQQVEISKAYNIRKLVGSYWYSSSLPLNRQRSDNLWRLRPSNFGVKSIKAHHS